MRKAIAFVAFLVLIATSGLGFAATKMDSQEVGWISGKVTAIDNGLLSLRESNGQIFRVAATSDKLKGVYIGDRVVVKDVNGWVASIKKTGKKSAKSRTSLTHRQA
jgi:hypothetical protein